MGVTQLYLVRHGETEWNAQGRFQGQLDSSLTECGREQAIERSAEMLAVGFDSKYCSTSIRTRQTIHALLNGDVADVHYRDELREIMLGSWQGKLSKDMQAENPEQFDLYANRPDQFNLAGAETFPQLQQRGLSALQDIVQAHRGQRVLVVSHGALIKAIVLQLLGWPLSQMWVEPRILNCSCSVLEYEDGQSGRVLSIADSDI